MPIIVYSAGERGLESHILCSKFGDFFIYGFIEGNYVTGLPTLYSLRHVYKTDSITPDTKVFGLILNHLVTTKALYCTIPLSDMQASMGFYVPMFVDDLKKFFRVYSSPDYAGFSVGFPYKEAVVEFCDEVHLLAQSIGAVNTIIWRAKDGKLIGYI